MLSNVEFSSLSLVEQKSVNGGFICAGLCVGIIAGVSFLAGSAFALGVYNGYNEAANNAE